MSVLIKHRIDVRIQHFVEIINVAGSASLLCTIGI